MRSQCVPGPFSSSSLKGPGYEANCSAYYLLHYGRVPVTTLYGDHNLYHECKVSQPCLHIAAVGAVMYCTHVNSVKLSLMLL